MHRWRAEACACREASGRGRVRDWQGMGAGSAGHRSPRRCRSMSAAASMRLRRVSSANVQGGQVDLVELAAADLDHEADDLGGRDVMPRACGHMVAHSRTKKIRSSGLRRVAIWAHSRERQAWHGGPGMGGWGQWIITLLPRSSLRGAALQLNATRSAAARKWRRATARKPSFVTGHPPSARAPDVISLHSPQPRIDDR